MSKPEEDFQAAALFGTVANSVKIRGRLVTNPEPKPAPNANIPREAEIENIKRQLSHLIDRVEGLKTKPA